MGLEAANTPTELNTAWPLGSDPKSEGDNHIRLLKEVLQNTHPIGTFLTVEGGADPNDFIGGTWTDRGARGRHDEGTGWRIAGSTLECWGLNDGSGTRTQSFPVSFASTPSVTIISTTALASTPGDVGDQRIVQLLGNPTVNDFTFWVSVPNTGSVSSQRIYWHAIGPAVAGTSVTWERTA